LSDKIAANDAGPYMQDIGYELRRRGQPDVKIRPPPGGASSIKSLLFVL
jgi:hypothetical protein